MHIYAHTCTYDHIFREVEAEYEKERLLREMIEGKENLQRYNSLHTHIHEAYTKYTHTHKAHFLPVAIDTMMQRV